jgi:2-polyprenyl-3-methyl-5-hydroxy-6-metoxy-1,4-benzoquinol methylase
MTEPVGDGACVVCASRPGDEVERTHVRSNVRAFRDEQFRVWRCPTCASIHAADSVSLDRYYRGYPFHALPDDARLRMLYSKQLGRLRRAGVTRSHSLLDYGCGDGAFVRFLRKSGYERARGYDAYSAQFADRAVLREQYDCVVSQDCLEHVESPLALLEQFHELTRAEARLIIGTPDASAIDLARPDEYAHTLHAPYHRHILSRRALIQAGERLGWRLERVYRTMYSNTRVPFLNERFYRYYLAVTDDTLDALVEPVRAAPLLRRLPLTLFYGLFGSFFSRNTDIAIVFRKP